MALNIVNADEIFARGVGLHAATRYAEAEQCYRQVLQMKPDYAAAYQNIGVLAFQVGRVDAAVQFLQKAIELSPNNPSIYCNLADAFTALRMGSDALRCYLKAVELDPNMATAYNNIGIVYSRLGKVAEAIASWQKAIELASKPVPPNQQAMRVLIGTGGGLNDMNEQTLLAAAASNNLGNAYLQQIKLDKALECHQRACDLSPTYANARSNLLRDYTHIPGISPEKLLAEHRKWWDIHTAGIKPMSHSNSRDPDRKLRVAFVSPDFREHSVTHFLLPLFEAHDPSQFDFIAYSAVSRNDEFTQRLAACTAVWRNTLGVSDEDLAKLIQTDAVDILIDLAGHTSEHRLRAFAFKPAPVQVSYLGYPMTSGSHVIDWHITDAISDPVGVSDSHYSERLYRLPTSAWCYRPAVDIPAVETPPVVRDPSLPFTFGSFNNCSKMSAPCFRLWSLVLKAVPNARMIIKASAMADQETREVVHNGFAKEGVPAERVVLVPQQLALADHFAYYSNIDLALDTYTYNGTTTTCEALWMNTPVLTLAGDMHISRVGASLLTNAGLGTLVAHSEEQFVDIAARLANDTAALVALRTGLRARFQASPVMNQGQFAADFGIAMRTIWKEWCASGAK